jgi:hypothetical protein
VTYLVEVRLERCTLRTLILKLTLALGTLILDLLLALVLLRREPEACCGENDRYG